MEVPCIDDGHRKYIINHSFASLIYFNWTDSSFYSSFFFHLWRTMQKESKILNVDILILIHNLNSILLFFSVFRYFDHVFRFLFCRFLLHHYSFLGTVSPLLFSQTLKSYQMNQYNRLEPILIRKKFCASAYIFDKMATDPGEMIDMNVCFIFLFFFYFYYYYSIHYWIKVIGR